jgi:hypothetical protein
MEWFYEFWASLTWSKILLGIVMFVVSFGFSTLTVAVVMVKIPENYFSSHYQKDFLPNTPWLMRWGAVIAKNVFGLFLIVIGIIMWIGPGPGLLTILFGLTMLDIPGKRPLEAQIIKRPSVLSAVNGLRAKYNRPPLVMD